MRRYLCMRTDERAGSSVAYWARQRTWDAIKPVKAKLAGFFVFVVGVCGVALAIAPKWYLWFGSGVFITATVGVALHLAMVTMGAVSMFLGADAEGDTATSLRKLARDGWSHVSDVFLPGRGNVDHVAVGPAAVFAVETKWTQHSDGDDDYERSMIEEAAWQAKNGARNVHFHLLAVPYQLRVPVLPVVVLWGGWRDRPDVSLCNDVPVVRGPHLTEWARAQPGREVSANSNQVDTADLFDALNAMAAHGDSKQAHREGPLVVKVGVSESLRSCPGNVRRRTGRNAADAPVLPIVVGRNRVGCRDECIGDPLSAVSSADNFSLPTPPHRSTTMADRQRWCTERTLHHHSGQCGQVIVLKGTCAISARGFRRY